MGIEDFQSEIDVFNEAKLNRVLYFYYCPDFLVELCKEKNIPFFSKLLKESGIILSEGDLETILREAVSLDSIPLLQIVASFGVGIDRFVFSEAMKKHKYEVARYIYPFDPRNSAHMSVSLLPTQVNRRRMDLYTHCKSVETLQFFLEHLKDANPGYDFRLERVEGHRLVFSHAISNHLEMAKHIYSQVGKHPRYDYFCGYTFTQILKIMENMDEECITFLFDNYRCFQANLFPVYNTTCISSVIPLIFQLFLKLKKKKLVLFKERMQ